LDLYTAIKYASSRRRGRRGRQPRNEAEHGFVLSTMRKKGDEDELLVIFWTKRYLGPDWAVLG
jgi:hypothetical protein